MYSSNTTSNYDLMKLMKNVKSFKGVFMKDTLPKTMSKRKSSGIINLDIDKNEGTHWVCYYNDPKNQYVEYFDSFGLAPPNEIISFLRKAGKQGIQLNTSQLQNLKSSLCGQFCVYYIKEREKGNAPYDVLYQLAQKPVYENESFIKKYIG